MTENHRSSSLQSGFESDDEDDSASDGEDESEEARNLFGATASEAVESNAHGKRTSPTMSQEAFERMLRELKFFPEIIQVHSLNQHIQSSMTRHGCDVDTGRLTFSAFLECICRIAFVYLSVYGNSVQLVAPSKCKCLWLITMLRVRCRELGKELNFPHGLVGMGPEASDEEGIFWHTRDNIVLDTMPLKHIVLWRAIDADVSSGGPQCSLPG